MVELAGSYGHKIDKGIVFDIELTQNDLGALVGADVDTAHKELRELKDQGVIMTGYRRTIIRDPGALKRIAQLDT